MDGDERDDRIIREKEFRRSIDIDLGDIEVPEDRSEERREALASAVDEALGEVFDPFKQADGSEAGAIQEDGTVPVAPDRDIVTEIASEGEKGVNWGLMIAMILVYSAIGVQAGMALSPLLAIAVLVLLASVGFAFGEIWVPNPKMKILGVTWVIISMKVLYGLAIELNRWDYIGLEMLGALLLALVAVNVFVAYRHDHDAIAAQSTLVLLAIGSTAGSLLDETGVAGMILIATLLVHGLALHRQSGNLAALGVAASNLWIGMHAITGGFEFGSLRIIALENSLLLFILLMVVSAINATMAARYAREENWFSQAFKAVGLGQPGLWGVSVSMGMVGALLAVASSREDVGYALGMVSFLGACFGGSYLAVRGVTSVRIMTPLAIAAAPLVSILVLGDGSGNIVAWMDSYEVFTILATIVTGFVLLRDQDRVTDRVLWLGSVVVLALLVILVPTKASDSGGDGGALLLGLLAAMHIGTAVLAVNRKSPALAGITVLLPWSWVLIEELVEEAIRTLLVANNKVDPGTLIDLEPFPLGVYLATACILMVVVNVRMGENGVNLASKFLGLSEVSASIRDSGALQLWSIGLWLPMLTILMMSQFGGFNAITLMILVSMLVALHLVCEVAGLRIGEPMSMAAILTVSLVAMQWRNGLFVPLSTLLCLSLMFLMFVRGSSREGLYTGGLAMMSMPILLALSGQDPVMELASSDLIPDFDSAMVSIALAAGVLAIYLPRSGSIEKLLNPALAALWLLVITMALAYSREDAMAQVASVTMFAVSSVWLVARGEIRSELKSIAKRDARIQMAAEAGAVREDGVSTYDPMAELYTTDVSHRPTVVLAILALVLGAGVLLGLLTGPNPLMLVAVGIFLTALIAIARARTKSLDLELPHIFGMEMPIALAIVGLVAIQVISHLGPGSSNRNLLDMAVLIALLLALSGISLIGKDRLLDRISIALDWVVIPLLAGRMLGAVMVEALPFPLTINPFMDDMLEWRLPWMLLESVLILCVFVDVLVDRKRVELDRGDWKGASGRGARSLFIVLLSFGPAGILAVASCIEQGWRYRQPTSVGMAIPAGLLALFSTGVWFETARETLPEVTMATGIVLLVLCAMTVPLKSEKWTMMLAVNSHMLLILVGLAGYVTSIVLPLMLIVLSTTVWVVGILQLRRTLRIWGLADLILAVLVALIFVQEITDPVTLLIALIVLAAELGLVSWLGQRNEDALLQD